MACKGEVGALFVSMCLIIIGVCIICTERERERERKGEREREGRDKQIGFRTPYKMPHTQAHTHTHTFIKHTHTEQYNKYNTMYSTHTHSNVIKHQIWT